MSIAGPDAPAVSPVVSIIAEVCHEANRAWCKTHGDDSVPASLPWDESPAYVRSSVCRGVNLALAGASPRELHSAWMADRLDAGWVLGPLKDEGAKTHPNLVAYDELPEEQRRKDALFHAIVGALAPAKRAPVGEPIT